jgi:hypothetical protein
MKRVERERKRRKCVKSQRHLVAETE